jgi:hypothetical protein
MSTEQEKQNIPSKEEVITFLQEQIEVKKVQLELQKLNTELAVSRAEEFRAIAFIGQMTNSPEEEGDEKEENENQEPSAPRSLKKVK